MVGLLEYELGILEGYLERLKVPPQVASDQGLEQYMRVVDRLLDLTPVGLLEQLDLAGP
jgi:hypothetical protein